MLTPFPESSDSLFLTLRWRAITASLWTSQCPFNLPCFAPDISSNSTQMFLQDIATTACLEAITDGRGLFTLCSEHSSIWARLCEMTLERRAVYDMRFLHFSSSCLTERASTANSEMKSWKQPIGQRGDGSRARKNNDSESKKLKANTKPNTKGMCSVTAQASIHDFKGLFYYMCICIWLNVCVCTKCTQVPFEARRNVRSPRTGDMSSCESPIMGTVNWTQVLYKEQRMLLTTEPSFQPAHSILKSYR